MRCGRSFVKFFPRVSCTCLGIRAAEVHLWNPQQKSLQKPFSQLILDICRCVRLRPLHNINIHSPPVASRLFPQSDVLQPCLLPDIRPSFHVWHTTRPRAGKPPCATTGLSSIDVWISFWFRCKQSPSSNEQEGSILWDAAFRHRDQPVTWGSLVMGVRFLRAFSCFAYGVLTC